MKKLASILFALSLILVSCETVEGPIGPMGPQGQAGADGLIGSIFEAEVDFTASNDFAVLVSFPEGIEVYNTDFVMAYVLQGVEDEVDVWEPLPQTVFFENNTLLYTFDHTFKDINLFLDGNFNLAELPASYTDGLVFRIAIIPAAFAENMNTNDINEVMGIMSSESLVNLKLKH